VFSTICLSDLYCEKNESLQTLDFDLFKNEKCLNRVFETLCCGAVGGVLHINGTHASKH